MARQQQDDEKSTREKDRHRKVRDISPYSKNFKCYIKSDERDLIYKRQMVIKLSRKDLEDKYIELCDENFFMKRHNNELHDRIKELTAKIVRISSTHRCFSTSAILKERTSENVNETSRTDPRFNSSYARPIIRSASLSNMFRRHLKSAPLSECNKSGSSSMESQKSSKQNGQNKDADSKNHTEKGELESPEKNTSKVEGSLVALQKRVIQLTEEVKAEQEKYAQVLQEKEELEKNLSDLDMKKYLDGSVETTRLKRKLGELVCFTKRMQTDFKVALCEKDHLLEIERAKYNSMMERLKSEEESESKNLLIELKSALKNVDLLTKTVSELENDKKLLLDQQATLSNLLKETTLSRELKMAEPPAAGGNAELLEKFNELKTEKAEIKSAQMELKTKVKDLQDINNKLLVELEEIKTIQRNSEKIRNHNKVKEDGLIEEDQNTAIEIVSDSKTIVETSPKSTLDLNTAGHELLTDKMPEQTPPKTRALENPGLTNEATKTLAAESNARENLTPADHVEADVSDGKPPERSANSHQFFVNKTPGSSPKNINPVYKNSAKSQNVDKTPEAISPINAEHSFKPFEVGQNLKTVNTASQTDVREVVIFKGTDDGEVTDSEITSNEALDSVQIKTDTVASEIEDGEVEEGEIVAIALRIAITR